MGRKSRGSIPPPRFHFSIWLCSPISRGIRLKIGKVRVHAEQGETDAARHPTGERSESNPATATPTTKEFSTGQAGRLRLLNEWFLIGNRVQVPGAPLSAFVAQRKSGSLRNSRSQVRILPKVLLSNAHVVQLAEMSGAAHRSQKPEVASANCSAAPDPRFRSALVASALAPKRSAVGTNFKNQGRCWLPHRVS